MNDEITRNFEECLVKAKSIVMKYDLHGYSSTIAIVEIAKFLYTENFVYGESKKGQKRVYNIYKVDD